MTLQILWIVYNPFTGDCLYAGSDLEQARLALVSKPMQGYVMHPLAADLAGVTRKPRKAAK